MQKPLAEQRRSTFDFDFCTVCGGVVVSRFVVVSSVAGGVVVAAGAAMAAVIVSAVTSWALPGYRMVPGSSVYKAKGY